MVKMQGCPSQRSIISESSFTVSNIQNNIDLGLGVQKLSIWERVLEHPLLPRIAPSSSHWLSSHCLLLVSSLDFFNFSSLFSSFSFTNSFSSSFPPHHPHHPRCPITPKHTLPVFRQHIASSESRILVLSYVCPPIVTFFFADRFSYFSFSVFLHLRKKYTFFSRTKYFPKIQNSKKKRQNSHNLLGLVFLIIHINFDQWHRRAPVRSERDKPSPKQFPDLYSLYLHYSEDCLEMPPRCIHVILNSEILDGTLEGAAE